VDNTWESEDQLNMPNLLKQYNKRHGLECIKTQSRLAKLHPPFPISSWPFITPTPTSTTQSTQTSPSSIY
jgi:hypothetical protein